MTLALGPEGLFACARQTRYEDSLCIRIPTLLHRFAEELVHRDFKYASRQLLVAAVAKSR